MELDTVPHQNRHRALNQKQYGTRPEPVPGWRTGTKTQYQDTVPFQFAAQRLGTRNLMGTAITMNDARFGYRNQCPNPGFGYQIRYQTWLGLDTPHGILTRYRFGSGTRVQC